MKYGSLIVLSFGLFISSVVRSQIFVPEKTQMQYSRDVEKSLHFTKITNPEFHLALFQGPIQPNTEYFDTFSTIALISTVVLIVIAIIIISGKQHQNKILNLKINELNNALRSYREKLKSANELLEQNKEQAQAAAQSLLLREEELAQASERIKKLNQELTAFSYSISHDLRAPLRIVNGYSGMLMEDYGEKLGDGGKKIITVIQSNADRMEVLINDLLDLATLGSKPVTKQKFCMQQLVEQVLHDKALRPETNLKVSPMEDAVGDAGLLRHVWENLISNAIKFSSKTSVPEIEIGYQKKMNEQVYWVKENGVGFDPAYADKLFKVFSRLHTKKEFEGTGAGLAIVKKIIDAHGGKVWAESELLKGATFYFSLPLN